MQPVNQVVDRAASTSQGRNGDAGPSEETKAKAQAFFARLVTVYGESRTKTLWRNQEQFRLTRREWADRVGELSWEQLETVFRRLKDRLEAGDPDFYWPDVARVLRLAQDSDSPKACHQQYRSPRLDEPDWLKRQKREAGKLAAATSVAVMKGVACFIEPEGWWEAHDLERDRWIAEQAEG